MEEIRVAPESSRWSVHAIIDAALPIVLTLVGFLSESPATWFGCLAFALVVIEVPVLGGAAVVTLLSRRFGTRLQGERAKPAPMAREAFETARSLYVAACLAAWPLAQWRLGHPTGVVWDLAPRGASVGAVIVETIVGVLVIDAWLYWKHRLLHTRFFWEFHKTHHSFRDPTAFAGYAVGPFEALLTFWPTVLVCIPQATHWAPLYFTLVVGFVYLNLYLHCGVALGWVEKTLPRLFLNTSAFHNVHHARANTHYAEALYLWDIICGTRLVDSERAPEASS